LFVNAAQSSGEWPGSRITFRETCLPGGMIEEVGAREAFGRTLVAGTRRDAAAEGGGRTKPLPGRGGGARLLADDGFRRGGLDGLFSFGGGGGIARVGDASDFLGGLSAAFAGISPTSGSVSCMEGGLAVPTAGRALGCSSRTICGGGGDCSFTSTDDFETCPFSNLAASLDPPCTVARVKYV